MGLGASFTAALYLAVAPSRSPEPSLSLPTAVSMLTIMTIASVFRVEAGNTPINLFKAATRPSASGTAIAFSHSTFSSGCFSATVTEAGFDAVVFGFGTVGLGFLLFARFFDVVVFGFFVSDGFFVLSDGFFFEAEAEAAVLFEAGFFAAVLFLVSVCFAFDAVGFGFGVVVLGFGVCEKAHMTNRPDIKIVAKNFINQL